MTFFPGTCKTYVLFIGKVSHVYNLHLHFYYCNRLSTDHSYFQYIEAKVIFYPDYIFLYLFFLSFPFHHHRKHNLLQSIIFKSFPVSFLFSYYLLPLWKVASGDFSSIPNYIRYYSLSSTNYISQFSNSNSHQIYVQIGETPHVHLHSPHTFSPSIFSQKCSIFFSL